MMEQKTLEKVALKLNEARLHRKPIVQLSKDGLTLTRSEAYLVQELGINLRRQNGEKTVGLKMGLTSEGKRRQMNLDSPLYGELTENMQIKSSSQVNTTNLIHPKIEPEIAFLISKTLEGEVTREQVLNSCEAIATCMEILDSRYDQFKYFSMEDVIADNSSSSHFVVGPWVQDFKEINLLELQMTMTLNGATVQEGISKEISGDPVVSVIELCRLLSVRHRKLEAGTIVLAGAATAAVEMKPGQSFELHVSHLPSVSVSVANV